MAEKTPGEIMMERSGTDENTVLSLVESVREKISGGTSKENAILQAIQEYEKGGGEVKNSGVLSAQIVEELDK